MSALMRYLTHHARKCERIEQEEEERIWAEQEAEKERERVERETAE